MTVYTLNVNPSNCEQAKFVREKGTFVRDCGGRACQDSGAELFRRFLQQSLHPKRLCLPLFSSSTCIFFFFFSFEVIVVVLAHPHAFLHVINGMTR